MLTAIQTYLHTWNLCATVSLAIGMSKISCVSLVASWQQTLDLERCENSTNGRHETTVGAHFLSPRFLLIDRSEAKQWSFPSRSGIVFKACQSCGLEHVHKVRVSCTVEQSPPPPTTYQDHPIWVANWRKPSTA